jgi:hypothetical protein
VVEFDWLVLNNTFYRFLFLRKSPEMEILQNSVFQNMIEVSFE